MTNHEALLTAIQDYPDEDTPRLVFADYLDEGNKDSSRAEFIRWQVEIARLQPSDARYQELFPQIRTRLARKGKEWTGNVVSRINKTFEFRRGFIEAANLTVAELRTAYRMILERKEPLRQLTVQKCGAVHAPGVLSMEHPKTLRTLRLGKAANADQLRDVDLPSLRWGKSLENVTSFELKGSFRAGLPDLANALDAPCLQTLVVGSHAHVETHGIVTLANAPKLPKLSRLEIVPLGPNSSQLESYQEAHLASMRERIREGVTLVIGGTTVKAGSAATQE